MKIIISERQFKSLNESEIEEKLGVPEKILETAEDLFNDIMDKIKQFENVEDLKDGFTIQGSYKVGNYVFNTINVNFELEIDPKYTPELYGAATFKKSRLSPKFTLQHVEEKNHLELIFKIFITPEQTVDEIVNLFIQEPEKMISTFTHELKHGYYDVNKKGEKSTDRADYQTFSSNRFGDIDPLNDFIFYSYYIHAIENVVRASELAQLLRLHGVSQKNFLEFFTKTDMYRNLKQIQNFTYDNLRNRLTEYLDEIRSFFDEIDIDYSDMNDTQIIDRALELLYINLTNWKGEVMKGILTSNFMESILGFSGDKDKFFRKYVNNITKYKDNPLQFFKSETERFYTQSTKMIKKLSKLYDYLSEKK